MIIFERKRKKSLKSLIALSLVTVLALATPNINAKADAATGSDASEVHYILDNIFINDMDMGGKTYEEAVSLLGYDDSFSSVAVNLSSDYGDISTTLGEIGLSSNAEEVVSEAMNYGNHGNILQRFKEREDLKTTPVYFDSKNIVDEDALAYVIEGAIGNSMSKSNSYSLNKSDDGHVSVVVEGQTASVDENATKAAIESIINTDGYSGNAVSASVVMASSQSDKMKQIGRIKDLLGSYTTSYSSSGAARKNNVQRAASLVDGHILFPGEQISVYNCIAPIEVSNGYELAHAYVGTEVVDSPGGGVCQVATTIYNAAIRAEIEIVQRNCHSMRVSYVPISADAAIAGGVLDLKLRNNLDAPIYIEAGYDGANLTFNIWGEEYRPSSRTIEFESIQTGVINPPDEPIMTEDKSLEPGTQEVTAAAVTGYTGELWKHIYENGVEVDKVCVNKSKYQASAQRISINTDPAEESEDEDDNAPEETAPPADNSAPAPEVPTEAPTEAPQPQPEPQPTPTPEPVQPDVPERPEPVQPEKPTE